MDRLAVKSKKNIAFALDSDPIWIILKGNNAEKDTTCSNTAEEG
jgi:hypothetical protein